MTIATRLLGHCQICEAEHKLTVENERPLLVLHGYKRPGWGHTVGRCFGAGQLPYELSRDRLIEYLARLNERASELPSAIDRSKQDLESLKPKYEDEYEFFNTPSDARKHYSETEAKIRGFENELWHLKHEIRRSEKRIADWAPSQIYTTEEQIAEKRAAQGARAAKRAKTEQAKREKRTASIAKEALANERYATEMREARAFTDQIKRQIVDSANSGDIEGGRKLYFKLRKKYKTLPPSHLEINEALLALGVATPSEYGYPVRVNGEVVRLVYS